LSEKKHGKGAARELAEMICEQDVGHGSSIAKARNRLQHIELNVTSKCGLFAGVFRQVTSILCVDSVISQG
jgi:hypothetical protein